MLLLRDEPLVKGHAVFAEVASFPEHQYQSLFMGAPVPAVHIRQLITSFNCIRLGRSRSRQPFRREPNFGVSSVNYDLAELMRAEVPR